MALESWPGSIVKLIGSEGGYSDHPADNGGKTKYGITQKTLDQWRKTHPGHPSVAQLNRSEAEQIYKAWYWDRCKCDRLPAGLDYLVFDAAVNSGPEQAAKWLQRAVDVTADGVIGPKTIAAATMTPTEKAIVEFNTRRLDLMV